MFEDTRIYTSRYSNKELNSGMYYTVGITLGKPKFQLGYMESEHCYMLAPDRSMWGKSSEIFSRMYKEKLDRYGKRKIVNLLKGLESRAEGKNIVLLCFEDVRDPEQNCHRTVFAEWVNGNIGLKITELEDPSPIRYKNRSKKREEEKRKPDLQINFFQSWQPMFRNHEKLKTRAYE